MRVKDSFEGNLVLNAERFRLEYLQDLKKEANQRAQAQAGIIALLLPTVLLLVERFSKSAALTILDFSLLVASMILLLGALAVALVVLIPIPTVGSSKLSPSAIPGTTFAELQPDGSFEIDVDGLRAEARTIAVLLRRRDVLLRFGATLLALAILMSSLILLRMLF